MDRTLLEYADKRHFWHPFTQMKEYEKNPPIVIERAKGVYVYDTEGKRYLDGMSSWWVNLAGHGHPRLDRALKAQIDTFSHVTTATLTHAPAIELAYELSQVLPAGLTRVFYSDDGSTAVETALKLVFQGWLNRGQPQRRRFVSLQEAYHGDTVGAVSVGDVPLYHKLYGPLLFDAFHVPSPSPRMAPVGVSEEVWRAQAIRALEQLLEVEGPSLAGIILEPLVQAAAGMYVYDPAYLVAVRGLCDRFGIPLIADEVAVGFGRTGVLFACEHAGISPDVICLSKALTGGYLPLGVTVATDALFEAFWGDYAEKKTFYHGHSYTGNPLGCALGLEVLALFREEGLLEALPEKIRVMQQGFEYLARLEQVGDKRGVGMIAAVELYREVESRTGFAFEERMGQKVCRAALERGLFVRPLGDVIYLMPPLSITVEEIEWSINVLADSIRHTLATP